MIIKPNALKSQGGFGSLTSIRDKSLHPILGTMLEDELHCDSMYCLRQPCYPWRWPTRRFRDALLACLSRTQVTPDQVRNLAYEVRDMKRAQNKGLQIKLLSDKANPPVKSTSKAAGYDLSSAHNDVVPAKSRKLIQTDLAMTDPQGLMVE